MEHKIEIRDLHYRVPTREILHDVSLQVDKNQFVGLIGPNGSGKTTLLKHIYRALPPEKNTVFINGREIEAFSYRETARQVTVMRQENGSDFDYTILEMVLMGRAPYRKFYERDTAEDKQIAYGAGYMWTGCASALVLLEAALHLTGNAAHGTEKGGLRSDPNVR